MFAGHSLDEDAGVFVDEDVGLTAWSVDASLCDCGQLSYFK